MNAHCVTDDELHAYVDGQLAPERRLFVERWLADDPDAARRAEDYRAQAALLHELFDPVLREPAQRPGRGADGQAARAHARQRQRRPLARPLLGAHGRGGDADHRRGRRRLAGSRRRRPVAGRPAAPDAPDLRRGGHPGPPFLHLR
ncbi:protein of unknown function [Azospirillum baldaniorum]|uniref:Anti-sigma factor n=1 Tax=Azospirillum baldaniorum TaxID=1064539 RepID=A0A9P1NLN8_9PROT|nr:protein of unknown function [Azospirillum baldaniorum]